MPPDSERDLEARANNVVALDDTEDFVIASNNIHFNYLHWMTQCLPAIDGSLRQKRSRGVRLLLPVLAPWQEETLRILGYSDAPRLTLKPDTFYYLPHAEYSEYLNGSTIFRVCLGVADTARRILERLPHDPRHGSDPVLFVPCSDPDFWKLANQDDAADLLRQRGVRIVDPGLSFMERVALFRQARVVIGPSGAGLADIVFCGPGTLLWEWMRSEHSNASFNRLAQAGEMDYWGEIIESEKRTTEPRQWFADIAAIRNRLPALSERLARQDTAVANTPSGHRPRRTAGRTIDVTMGEFESLGDNCEFGLIQRNAEMEPLGLFRFAGISLDRLIDGLHDSFAGLGDEGTVTHYLGGTPGTQEYMIRDSVYGIQYHSGLKETEAEPDAVLAREIVRLRFLKRKLLEDLRDGTKIWVWRGYHIVDRARLDPLMAALRAHGPNRLLWVVAADETHPSGTVERLEEDLFKGYVRRLATYRAAYDFDAGPWYDVCEQVYDLCHPEARTQQAAPLAPPATAMDRLARGEPPQRPEPAERRGWFARLRRLLGF